MHPAVERLRAAVSAGDREAVLPAIEELYEAAPAAGPLLDAVEDALEHALDGEADPTSVLLAAEAAVVAYDRSSAEGLAPRT